MFKEQISSASGKSSAKRKKLSSKASSKKAPSDWLKSSLKVHKFVGLALGGGKADRSSLAVIEYYPNQKKIFLSQLEEKISSDAKVSADQKIIEIIESHKKKTEFVAMDAPLKLPKCMRCKLKCPGYEKCDETEIKWLWDHYKKHHLKKRPKKLFTPYTERCAENYVSMELEEKFSPQHMLGANMAPVASRALFLQRRISKKCIEVYPKLSLWRIGRSLGIQKSYLRFHKHSFDGEEIREAILNKLISSDTAFIYAQDQKQMIQNGQSFDSFICALTGVLEFQGQVEKRPKNFPKAENWLSFPTQQIEWA